MRKNHRSINMHFPAEFLSFHTEECYLVQALIEFRKCFCLCPATLEGGDASEKPAFGILVNDNRKSHRCIIPEISVILL